ncbi:MAG: hypothetical protein CSA26_10760 [Desulfobacterales bacterium]|nr:MAG: hypothetical protein CSA26_10760 [Desulfobacterales bacterium]
MEFKNRQLAGIDIESSFFYKNGVDELHFYVKGTAGSPFNDQLVQISSGIDLYLEEVDFPAKSVVSLRLFVSDYANQEAGLETLKKGLAARFSGCAVSIIQQPPLEGQKLAAWVYAVRDQRDGSGVKEFDLEKGSLACRRGSYVHLWDAQLASSGGGSDSSRQTDDIFSNFDSRLQQRDLCIKDNCIRTWLFVRDIDYNYKGVVDSRLKFFENLGMTKDTHFIASTGIEGRVGNPDKNVIMDAYSVGGICREQVKYLAAPDYLNPTHEYGVTFERGTSVDFGDRRHIYISGTASIDNRGEVVHRGDVYRQAGRTFENIRALLEDAEAEMSDIAQMIVYLRDVNDAVTLRRYLEENYPEIPKVVVLAPVCRPGWLVEIECIAIKDISRPEYADF